MQKGRFNRSAPSCHPSFLVPHTQLDIANNSRPVATSTGCNLSANPSTSRLWNSVASPERCCAHTSTRAKLGPCFTDHSCRENRHADKEGSSNRATLTLITKRSHMRHPQHSGLLTLLLTLAHSAALCTPSLAGDVALLSIGPRFGFSGKTPILGKEQKHYFHTIDVAAVFKLPWSWPLGESSWSLETRLITSAGLLQAANESGLIATVVPNLALRGWGGDLSPSTPERGQDPSATTHSACKTSEVRFKSSRLQGFASTHSRTPLPDFVHNTSPTRACTDLPVSAWTCTLWNSNTSFSLDASDWRSCVADNRSPPWHPIASTLTTHTAARSVA